jgi:hypothetical protein
MKRLNDVLEVSTKSTFKNKYEFDIGTKECSVYENYSLNKLQNVKNNKDDENTYSNKVNMDIPLYFESGGKNKPQSSNITSTFADDFLNQRFADIYKHDEEDNEYTGYKQKDNTVKPKYNPYDEDCYEKPSNYTTTLMNNIQTEDRWMKPPSYPLVIPETKPKIIEKSIDINRKVINIDDLQILQKVEQKQQPVDDAEMNSFKYLKDIIKKTKADIDNLDLELGDKTKSKPTPNYDDEDINPRKLPNLISK